MAVYMTYLYLPQLDPRAQMKIYVSIYNNYMRDVGKLHVK